MNHLAALIAAVIAALTLTTTPAVADATDPPTITAEVMCSGPLPHVSFQIDGVGVIEQATVRYLPDERLVGLVLPTKQGYFGTAGERMRFELVVGGVVVSKVVPMPDCDPPTVIGPGVKPKRVFDRDRRRSCKHEAKVWERVQEIRWTLSEDYGDNVIFKFWSPQRFDYGWSRVLPTPYGCRLNHRAWVKRHGVDGKAVRRS